LSRRYANVRLDLTKINDYPLFVKIAIFNHKKTIPLPPAGGCFFIKYGEIRMCLAHAGACASDSAHTVGYFDLRRLPQGANACESLHLRHKSTVFLIELPAFLFRPDRLPLEGKLSSASETDEVFSLLRMIFHLIRPSGTFPSRGRHRTASAVIVLCF